MDKNPKFSETFSLMLCMTDRRNRNQNFGNTPLHRRKRMQRAVININHAEASTTHNFAQHPSTINVQGCQLEFHNIN